MDRIDAVLPLTERDAERARRLLIPSIHTNLHCLGRLWVVVPHRQVKDIRRALPSVEVVSEYDVVPELRVVDRLPVKLALQADRLRRWTPSRPHMIERGWFKQQLVKLAIADHVD